MSPLAIIGCAALGLGAAYQVARIVQVRRRERRLLGILRYLADHGEASGPHIAEDLGLDPLDPRLYDDLDWLVLQGRAQVRKDKRPGPTLYRLAWHDAPKGPRT